MKKIITRDGYKKDFNATKIFKAINSAYLSLKLEMPGVDEDLIKKNIIKVIKRKLQENNMTIEEIQDIVEKELMLINPEVAKSFILYREEHKRERQQKIDFQKTLDDIVNVAINDTNNENANMSAATPSGQMLTFASETTKKYVHDNLLKPYYSDLHKDGYIHIHDLDYYSSKTTTCLQYNLEDLFEKGFITKNGFVRQPQSIHTYLTLAAIVFQTNQNEQHKYHCAG